MVSVLSSAESEALIVKSILEASSIPALVEGASLPGAYRFSGYEVLVPEEFESDARRIIAEAKADAEAPTEN